MSAVRVVRVFRANNITFFYIYEYPLSRRSFIFISKLPVPLKKSWNYCQPHTCDATLTTIILTIRSSPSFSRSLSRHPPSPAWRVANRAVWRSFGHSTMIVFELAFRIPPRPQIPSPLNTLFHGKTALSLSVILDIPQVRDTSGRPRVTRARKSVGLRGARRPDDRFPSKCTPPPYPQRIRGLNARARSEHDVSNQNSTLTLIYCRQRQSTTAVPPPPPTL